jgi:hypothetical protein
MDKKKKAARDTLDRWGFAKLLRGDPSPFSSPGVVLKCRELESATPGEQRFQILGMLGAKNDAGAVAQSLLKHPRPAGDSIFVMLAPVPAKSHFLVMKELEPLCVRVADSAA